LPKTLDFHKVSIVNEASGVQLSLSVCLAGCNSKAVLVNWFILGPLTKALLPFALSVHAYKKGEVNTGREISIQKKGIYRLCSHQSTRKLAIGAKKKFLFHLWNRKGHN
jgi:hypothetical protein